jgi:hypothetical protein
VPINNLLLRILVAGLPLVMIALVAGSVGYFAKGTQREPIPPLPPRETQATGVEGAIQAFDNDRVAIVTADGTQMTFELPGESSIEQLVPITRADLALGDWINGGAIQHEQSILALTGLVLISDPVVNGQ